MTTPNADSSSTQSPPASSTEAGESWGWTRGQRIAVGALVACLLVFLLVQYIRRPFGLHDGPVVLEGDAVALVERVDPNLASREELARIPHIGEALATKIVTWRDARIATAPDGIVYHSLDDLDRVPGIGKSLLDSISPYLRFPPDSAASEPALVP